MERDGRVLHIVFLCLMWDLILRKVGRVMTHLELLARNLQKGSFAPLSSPLDSMDIGFTQAEVVGPRSAIPHVSNAVAISVSRWAVRRCKAKSSIDIECVASHG